MRVAVVDTMRVRFKWRARGVGGTEATLLHFRLLQSPLGLVTTLLEIARFKVEGMASVDVVINWITSIGGIDGGREVVVESEAVNTFAKPVEVVVLRKSIDKFDKLVFIDKLAAFGGEDDIASGLPSDREPKRWVIAPVELEVCAAIEVFSLWLGN